MQRRRDWTAAPPSTRRRRGHEHIQRTLICNIAGDSGGSGGTGNADGDGRTLAAASEAARDDAHLFVQLQRAHICIVVVSIVSTTVPDVEINT